MNSRERLLKTIRGEVTDRVPVTLFIQDHGHFIHQLHPDIDPLDYEQLTFKVINAGKGNGPFIIQSADFLEYTTPLANVEEFVITAFENAKY